jgi:hypothetical protein
MEGKLGIRRQKGRRDVAAAGFAFSGFKLAGSRE